MSAYVQYEGMVGSARNEMQLTVQDVANLLKVSEKTVYRWIADNGLPGYRISGQFRFNRAELLEWATSRRIQVSPQIFQEPESGGTQLDTMTEGLQAGGIHYRVGGAEKESALRCVVETLPLPEEVDRSFLLQVLLAREALSSTGIGDGIAIPHVRNPIVMHVPRPMVSLCFLERPVEFGALDGRPVYALFTLISPSVRAHLHLLSRLAFLLRDDGFKSAISRQAMREDILSEARRVEDSLANT